MAVGYGLRAHRLSLPEKVTGLHWPFVAVVLLIGLIGYGGLYSAAGGAHEPWAWRHGVRLGVGVTVMLAVALVDVRLLLRAAYPFYGLVLGLLIAVEIMGEINKGAQRWIDLGPVQLQPSELMKVALILALARYFHVLHLDDIGRPTRLLVPLAMILVPAGLVLKQPDLGTAVMLIAAGGAMLFLAGVRLWKFGLVGVAGAVALPLLWSQLHDYQRQRIFTFLDPESDPLGSGYHIIQSKIALGSGGVWGRGFLQGSQAQLSFLPEKQTDFAFTMLAEEAGFIGAIVVLALNLALLLLLLAIALRTANQFGRLVVMGVSVTFALYVLINVAMVTGLIPVVGVPMPLISYGGTAMLTVLLSFGLVLAIDVQRDTVLPRNLSLAP
jgi:rod shape determining protein RodA